MGRLVVHNFVHRRAYVRDCGGDVDCGCGGARDAWTRADLERKDEYALRNIAKHAGLPQTGSREELVAIILASQERRGYGFGSNYAGTHAPRGRDESTWMAVSHEIYTRLEIGKTYKFNGRRGKILAKEETSGQKSAAGWEMGGPLVRVEWKD